MLLCGRARLFQIFLFGFYKFMVESMPDGRGGTSAMSRYFAEEVFILALVIQIESTS
jgi:hypothetical protein